MSSSSLIKVHIHDATTSECQITVSSIEVQVGFALLVRRGEKTAGKRLPELSFVFVFLFLFVSEFWRSTEWRALRMSFGIHTVVQSGVRLLVRCWFIYGDNPTKQPLNARAVDRLIRRRVNRSTKSHHVNQGGQYR